MRQLSSLCAVFRAVMFLGLNLILAVCSLSFEIRIASASYPYPVDGCGESSFIGASGVVRYSDPYGSYRFREQGCSYRITVGSNNSVSLRFQSLNLQSTGGPCLRTWITLMCSLDQTKEAITKTSSEICHEAKWGTSLRVNDCPVLFVILHKPTSDTTYSSQYRPSLRSGSFQLNYQIRSTTPTSSQVNVTDRPEIECGQTLFTNRSGVIILPKRTDVAMATINCTYTIESTAQRRISVSGIQKSISLDISHFDLLTLTDSLDAYDQDRLQIVCTGIGGERRTVWGRAQHFQPKYRDCVKLEIILRSDSYDPTPTRQISYYRKPGDTASEIEEDEEEEDEGDDRSNVGCGYTIFTASSGNVTSPGFPLSHPHSIHCIYHIKVDTEKVIFLNFLRFSLETSTQCSYDWLKISCGLPEMNKTRKFCGDIQWTAAIRYLNCSTVSLMFYADSSVTKGGFQIEYWTRNRETSDSTDDVVDCGRTDFRGDNGTITLPNNPSKFMKTIDCTYNIFADESSFIFLNLTSINITEIANSIASCNIEHLLIACVNGTDSWRFDLCERRFWSPQPRFSECRQVQIKLYSKYFDFQKSYEIPYKVVPSEEICGNTHFTASAGVISSPGFPRYYPPNVNCTYSIVGADDSTISIRFPIFSVADSQSVFTSPDCRDWILMSCPSSNYVTPYADRRFCGQLTWPPVIHFFNCSTLLLKFSSGPAAVQSYAPSQFILNYTISNSVTPSNEDILPELGCGDLYISTESGRARLENNASLPLASVNCTFTTSMNGSRKGAITINMFSILRIAAIANESSDCSQDHITITCMSDKATANINSRKSLRYCWNTFTGASMNYSDCDSIRFSLIYGVYIPQQGRAISYSITSKDCGDTEFSNSAGNVKSPRYPGNYPPSMHCVYMIEAGRNKTVSLKSVDVKIEGGGRTPYGYDNCPHDWLIIRCNGGTERIPETNVPTPAPPPPYDDDDYDFDLDYDSYHHLMDRYRFRRSHFFSPPSSFLNRRLCGTDEIRTTLMNCETVTLEFHTDSSVAYQGFNIQYNRTISDTTTATTTSTVRPVVDYICENETFRESVGIINSPNFTDRTNCSYVIEAGESNWVILEFLALSAGSSPSHYYRRYAGDCHNTWLQVTCVPGSRISINPLQGRRFCTLPSRNSILSGCQHVSIHFYSSVRASFRIRYTVSDTGECGKSNFTNSTGTITSPGFPLLYPDNIDCTYYVEVGADNWLSLRIRTFNLEGAGGYGYSPDLVASCPYDYLQLTCASRESGASSELLNRTICGYRLPFETKLTACRRAALRFATDSSHEREGFQIEYRVYKNGEDECGNKTFSNLPGVISSPDFPSPYRDDLNCSYFLEIGGKRSVVLLQFLSFAVQFFGRRSLFGGCDSDWLQMRCVAGNVVDPNNVLNKRMCGHRLPFENATLTGCERLALDFFSDPTVENRGSGFQLKYRTFNPDDVCGKTLFYNSSEKLPLPKSPPNYITPFNCTYSIYVGNYSVATFDIRSFTDKTDEKTIRPKKDWILISCRGKEVNESNKITHESGSQTSRKISDCSVVIDVIFHKENETSERFFSISYELNLRDATSNPGGSNPVGVGIGIFFILIFVALIILAVVWWRRKRRLDQKLDSRPFVPDEDEPEQSDPGITTTEDGFSFTVHQPDKASCKKYISLNSMT